MAGLGSVWQTKRHDSLRVKPARRSTNGLVGVPGESALDRDAVEAHVPADAQRRERVAGAPAVLVDRGAGDAEQSRDLVGAEQRLGERDGRGESERPDGTGGVSGNAGVRAPVCRKYYWRVSRPTGEH